jgi:hypothetical protein
MIARVPNGDWAALDQREWAYDRVLASSAITHAVAQELEIAVYAVPEWRHTVPTTRYPILLSYLDVVVQGYLHHYGEAGVDRFFETTMGWESPVLNDRARPRYPRHQVLNAGETACVNRRLKALDVQMIDRIDG